MSLVVVLTAAELEAAALARALELPHLAGPAFPAFGRGMLRVAAVGLRASLLAARLPGLLVGAERVLVVSAGVCGGLDPALPRGALVVPESVLGPNGQRVGVTPSAHRAAVLLAGGRSGGLLVTVEAPVTGAEDKVRLRARTGAVAVDMESWRILGAASRAGAASLVLRAVVDAADEGVPPELGTLVGPEGRLRRSRALALAVGRPRLVPRALALGRATRQGLRAVASVLAGLSGEGGWWTPS